MKENSVLPRFTTLFKIGPGVISNPQRRPSWVPLHSAGAGGGGELERGRKREDKRSFNFTLKRKTKIFVSETCYGQSCLRHDVKRHSDAKANFYFICLLTLISLLNSNSALISSLAK